MVDHPEQHFIFQMTSMTMCIDCHDNCKFETFNCDNNDVPENAHNFQMMLIFLNGKMEKEGSMMVTSSWMFMSHTKQCDNSVVNSHLVK